ncbi:MAG: pyridoxal phosphate-dependent aminotransferase [Bryobacteraceae bacterium]
MTPFSSRTPRSLEPNALWRRVQQLRAAGAQLIDLTLSNPTQAGLAYPESEILAALADGRAVLYEPEPRGHAQARRAIAAWHARHGAAVNPGDLVLTSSTSEAYSWLFKLLCEPGDAVMTPRPSYPLFECLAGLEGVRAVQYPLPEDRGWQPDITELELHLDPRARAVVIVNPNNPTGTYLRGEDWLRLQEFAALRGLALIVDEVFYDYSWSSATVRASSLVPPHLALTFTLSGLSKAAGLPQMKLGWIHAGGPERLRREALERLEWIADAYLPVSGPVQFAAPLWLDLAPAVQERILTRVLGNRAVLEQLVGQAPAWRVRESGGGWTALLEAPRILSEEEWVLRLMEEAHVIVQPGYFYDFEREAFLAVSLLPEPERFQEAARRLERIFRSV